MVERKKYKIVSSEYYYFGLHYTSYLKVVQVWPEPGPSLIYLITSLFSFEFTNSLPYIFSITRHSLPDLSFSIWQTLFYFLSFFLLFCNEHKPTWQQAFCLFPSFSKTKSWFQNSYHDKAHTEKHFCNFRKTSCLNVS